MESVNGALAQHLIAISGYYTLANDTYRAKTFNEAGLNIDNQSVVIVSGKQAKTLIPRVGPSTMAVIDEFLQTGTSARMQELETKYARQHKIIKEFSSLYGIGPVTAVKFYEDGCRTIEDLWNSPKLTEAQKTGIIWREHINLRIPYEEMLVIELRIAELLSMSELPIRWDIAGSFRRKKESSGDVDLLIQTGDNLGMDKILELLSPIIVAPLATGPTKFMGILRLSDDYNGHRIDIRLLVPPCYAYGLMYFTGSQKFNILMRRRAMEYNLTLNEYTLYDDATGIEHPAQTEEEIFEHLGLTYLSPDLRTDDIETLL